MPSNFRLRNARPRVIYLTNAPKPECSPVYKALCDLTPAVEIGTGEPSAGYLASADLAVAWAYRFKVGRAALEACPVVNLHPGFLPHCRGAHPLYWALRDPEKPVGVTMHWMDEGIDTGAIIDQGILVGWIEPGDTLRLLHDRAEFMAAAMVRSNWRELLTLEPGRPQRPGGSFHRADELPKLRLGWDTPCVEVAAMGPPAADEGFTASGG